MERIIFDFHSSLLDQDMDFTKNSDDPLGVQALLAILRSQQDDPSSIDPDQSNPSSSSYSPNDAIFINKHPENVTKDPRLASRTQYQHSDGAGEKEKQREKELLQGMSFSKALPILTKLAADQDFLRELIKLKEAQDELERSLSEEREKILGSDDPDKPSLKTQGLLTRWSHQSLQKWDDQVTIQQETLEDLGVPCFFKTKDREKIRKQGRIFDILVALLE